MNDSIDNSKDKIIELFKKDSNSDTKTIMVKKNENIYTYGGQGSFFLIDSGHVRVSTQTDDGKMCNIGFYAEGDFFGETGFSGEVIPEIATALTDSTIRRIDVIKKINKSQHYDISHSLIAHLSQKIIIHQNTLSSFIAFNSEKRLAYVLMMMSSEFENKRDDLSLIKNKITHQDLSHLIGTTRSRVGYFMNLFLKQGIIRKSNDCFLVVDRKRIKEYLTT